ncbi:MAG TPA: phosphatidate cytidylyltransferase [Candidatus Angelobacter sp.]|nr:phosphatidate cytidylyltransferase [Candidatus Angelobacter sp.]
MRSASSTAATAGTVPPANASTLRTRVVSALILAPLALGAAYLGRPVWDVLVAAMGASMAWEWARLCSGGRVSRVGAVSMAIAPAAVAVAALMGVIPALIIVGAGVVLIGLGASLEGARNPAWPAVGVAYVGVPCLAMAWLRARPDDGLAALLWVLALVWATDTGAYIAGRGLGGPKLAPRISPNKTWAGLIGGMVAAAAVGLAGSLLMAGVSASIAIPVSAALAVVEQAGDLFESAVKRHFGVKDSSHLIPGHGGVLDRVDGLLAVSLVVAALSWAVGHTILIWR